MQTKFNMNSIILLFKWWIIEFIVNFVCMFLWNWVQVCIFSPTCSCCHSLSSLCIQPLLKWM